MEAPPLAFVQMGPLRPEVSQGPVTLPPRASQRCQSDMGPHPAHTPALVTAVAVPGASVCDRPSACGPYPRWPSDTTGRFTLDSFRGVPSLMPERSAPLLKTLVMPRLPRTVCRS